MRVAICLSGQPRSWRATHGTLREFFAGHDLHVFIHTWREGDPEEIQAVLDAYSPRATKIEDRPLFVEEKLQLVTRYPVSPPLPLFDMFHSVASSLALAATQGEPFDVVVRARFDTLFDGAWSHEVPSSGSLIIPALYPHASGCTDQFALGSMDDMVTYGGVSDWLKSGSYPQFNGDLVQPERLLRHYLEQVSGLTVDIRPMAMKLLRESQVGRRFSDVADDPLFHAAKHEEWEAFAFEKLPSVAALANFEHVARLPLNLERSLSAWLESKPQKAAFQLLRAPWPVRIKAVDNFIAEQTGEMEALDDASYDGIRLMCAMLLQRMDRKEPMGLESFVVHALSANAVDMQLAHDWVGSDPAKLDGLQALSARLGPITQALTFANPLEQTPIGAWRPL